MIRGWGCVVDSPPLTGGEKDLGFMVMNALAVLLSGTAGTSAGKRSAVPSSVAISACTIYDWSMMNAHAALSLVIL